MNTNSAYLFIFSCFWCLLNVVQVKANQSTAQRSSNKAITLNVAIGIDKANSREAALFSAGGSEK